MLTCAIPNASRTYVQRYEDEEYDGWYFVLPGGRLAYNKDCDDVAAPSTGWTPIEHGKPPGPSVTIL